ncbi:LHFPL tetraspan subfamily member 1 protein, partial [Sarcoptes scabiei]
STATAATTSSISSSSNLLCIFVWWTAFSLIASILIGFGFWLPYWLQGLHENSLISFSPFRRCNYPLIDQNGYVQIVLRCIRYESFSDIPSFAWKLTTILVGLGFLFSSFVTMILLFSCCMPRALTSSNTVLLVLSQLLIIIVIVFGCLLYFLGWNTAEFQSICGINDGLFEFDKCYPSFSIYLLGIGVSLLFICLIFGLITSQQLRKSHLQN